jgi:hypothetical protein
MKVMCYPLFIDADGVLIRNLGTFKLDELEPDYETRPARGRSVSCECPSHLMPAPRFDPKMLETLSDLLIKSDGTSNDSSTQTAKLASDSHSESHQNSEFSTVLSSTPDLHFRMIEIMNMITTIHMYKLMSCLGTLLLCFRMFNRRSRLSTLHVDIRRLYNNGIVSQSSTQMMAQTNKTYDPICSTIFAEFDCDKVGLRAIVLTPASSS